MQAVNSTYEQKPYAAKVVFAAANVDGTKQQKRAIGGRGRAELGLNVPIVKGTLDNDLNASAGFCQILVDNTIFTHC